MGQIKLIASDMDGTLLTNDKRLPPDFYEILHALEQQGVLFVAGSGRTYSALQQNFPNAPSNMHFICDNGSFVVEDGQNTFLSVIEPALWRRAAAAAEEQGELVRAVLSGVHGVYIHEYRGVPSLRKQLESSYSSFVPCADFAAVEDDIFKIAVCDMRGAGDHSFPPLRAQFGSVLNVICSGPFYLDMMNPGISKGSALAHFQRERGILPEETMVFGDFFNDVEMLACGKYSFVMENAAPGMFAHGNFRAPSNEAYGVAEIIRRYVLNGEPLPQLENTGR